MLWLSLNTSGIEVRDLKRKWKRMKCVLQFVRSHKFKLFKLCTSVSEDGGGRPKHVACNVRFKKIVVFDASIGVITNSSQHNGMKSIKVIPQFAGPSLTLKVSNVYHSTRCHIPEELTSDLTGLLLLVTPDHNLPSCCRAPASPSL
jgi:hypothetical protein